MEQNNPTPTSTPAVSSSPSQAPTSPKKRQINKTLLLVIGLIILTVILLAVSLTIKRGSLPSLTRDDSENMENIAHTTVTVSDDVQVASAAGAYQTDILVEPNGNRVTGIQLDLSYDPKVITVVDITPGPFFPNPTVLDKVIDAATGKVTITIATAMGADAITENGSVATLTFRKVGEGNVVIDILPSTLVTDSRYSQSVLDGSVSADIETLPNIGSSNTSAVPTTANPVSQ